MARDLSQAYDAVERAQGINAGLDGLVSLLLGCNDADVPSGKCMAELIWSIQKDMDQALKEISAGMKP